MIRIFTFSFFIILFFVACYRPAPQVFNDLKSLQGTWSTIDGAKFNENWTLRNDSTLIGTGFSLRDKDTLFVEQLKIYRSGNEVYYAAQVGSNKNYVDFKLEEANQNSWKFKNPDHDYPNIIQYTIINDSLLEAKTMNIRGKKEIVFNMKLVVK